MAGMGISIVSTPKGVMTDRRARAFTAFVKAYAQCRAAVAYLRWEEGDVDEIAPLVDNADVLLAGHSTGGGGRRGRRQALGVGIDRIAVDIAPLFRCPLEIQYP